MIEGDQGIEINDLPGRLVTPGLLHPRRPGAGRRLRRRLLRKLLEQTRFRHRRLSIFGTGAENQIHPETATGKNSQPLSAPRSIKGMLDKVDGKLEAGMSGLFQAPAIA
jgi:hypothetical protein